MPARSEDADGNVRAAALLALERIAEKWNAGAITVMSSRLEHADGTVRAAALLALARIAE